MLEDLESQAAFCFCGNWFCNEIVCIGMHVSSVTMKDPTCDAADDKSQSFKKDIYIKFINKVTQDVRKVMVIKY